MSTFLMFVAFICRVSDTTSITECLNQRALSKFLRCGPTAEAQVPQFESVEAPLNSR